MFSHQFISQRYNLIICVTSPIIVLTFLSAIIYDNPLALPQINFSKKPINAISCPISKFGTIYLQRSQFALEKNGMMGVRGLLILYLFPMMNSSFIV